MIDITSARVVTFALYLRPLSASESVSCGQTPFVQNVHVKTPVHVRLLDSRRVDEEEALGHHERGPPRRRPGQREAGGELGPTPSRHERARPPEREPARGYARPTTTCRSLDLMREPSGNPSTSVFPRSSAGPAADVLMPARLGRALARGGAARGFGPLLKGAVRGGAEETFAEGTQSLVSQGAVAIGTGAPIDVGRITEEAIRGGAAGVFPTLEPSTKAGW